MKLKINRRIRTYIFILWDGEHRCYSAQSVSDAMDELEAAGEYTRHDIVKWRKTA